jgi:hypothetical protein
VPENPFNGQYVVVASGFKVFQVLLAIRRWEYAREIAAPIIFVLGFN